MSRLLVATENRGIVGGIELHIRATLPLLAAAGFEIGLLTGRGSPDLADSILSRLPDCPNWHAENRSVADVMRDILAWRPKAVYSHGLIDTRLEEALTSRFPTVYFPHCYAGTCISGTKCHSRPGYEVCRRVLGPGCLVAYFPSGCGGRNPLTMLRLYSDQRHKQAILNRYRSVIVASQFMFDEYSRHGVPAHRLHLISYFPPDALPDLVPPAPRPRTDRILFVGRITHLKGLDHLIAAIPLASKQLGRKLSLVVAGEGEARESAETAARRAGIDAEFIGWVDAERRQAEMRVADLLAVPSLWPEPFGQVGVQAGCAGLPAVGYAAGGIPDWLVPGVSGESAPGDRPDWHELAGAIVRALKDDEHWQRLRMGAWDKANWFTTEYHMDHLLPVLRAVVRP